jgi:hypothetical protein
VGNGVQPGDWVLLTENPEVVLSALERGETDGILPAASEFMDRFAQFMLKIGIPRLFDEFPDHRKRKWIAPFFFCNVLLHKSLFRLRSLNQIGPFLFSSPDVMRTLGFQMRQVQHGFYKGSSLRPFNEEALSDFFDGCDLSDFLTNQKLVLQQLLESQPEIVSDGSLVMDVVDVRTADGRKQKGQEHLDACVLCSMSQGELLPILWNVLDADTKADVTQGKLLMSHALPLLSGKVKRLIVDRGFISGKWITGLKKKHGLDVVIGLKSDMVLHQDMVALCQLDETIWLEAEPPKYHKGKIPIRHLCYLSDLEMWEECKVPLAGIVIRDSYNDKTEYYTVVTTDLEAEPQQIHRWIRSRWGIEETFMTESRYGCLNRIGPCRRSVAAAVTHFSLLAYTLIRLFAQQEEHERKYPRPQLPTARVEFVAYWQSYYAIIFPSQLVELVARCAASWGEKLPSILQKLRAVEQPP